MAPRKRKEKSYLVSIMYDAFFFCEMELERVIDIFSICPYSKNLYTFKNTLLQVKKYIDNTKYQAIQFPNA